MFVFHVLYMYVLQCTIVCVCHLSLVNVSLHCDKKKRINSSYSQKISETIHSYIGASVILCQLDVWKLICLRKKQRNSSL